MFKHIKKELNGNKDEEHKYIETDNYTNNNGLNILMNYVPIINEVPNIEYNSSEHLENNDNDNTKKIKDNKK